jgi:hypothetical protein
MGIMYDHSRLEELAGASIEPLAEDDSIGRMAARTVCDFHSNPNHALSNARHWITIARKEAYVLGEEAATKSFKKRILEIFKL